MAAASEYERGLGCKITGDLSHNDEYDSEYDDAVSRVHGQERMNGSRHLCGQGIDQLAPSQRLFNEICVHLYHGYRIYQKFVCFAPSISQPATVSRPAPIPFDSQAQPSSSLLSIAAVRLHCRGSAASWLYDFAKPDSCTSSSYRLPAQCDVYLPARESANLLHSAIAYPTGHIVDGCEPTQKDLFPVDNAADLLQ